MSFMWGWNPISHANANLSIHNPRQNQPALLLITPYIHYCQSEWSLKEMIMKKDGSCRGPRSHWASPISLLVPMLLLLQVYGRRKLLPLEPIWLLHALISLPIFRSLLLSRSLSLLFQSPFLLSLSPPSLLALYSFFCYLPCYLFTSNSFSTFHDRLPLHTHPFQFLSTFPSCSPSFSSNRPSL